VGGGFRFEEFFLGEWRKILATRFACVEVGAAMAAHSLAALVCSDVAGVSYHSSNTPASLARSGSLLLASLASGSSSPPNSLQCNGRIGETSFTGSPLSGGASGGGGGGQSTRGSGRKEVGVASASLQGIFGGLFKGADTGEAARQQYTATVAQVNALEMETQMLSDEDLRASTVELKKRARSGESMDSILPVSSPLIILFLSLPPTYLVAHRILLGLQFWRRRRSNYC
jgi:hypothetical protein